MRFYWFRVTQHFFIMLAEQNSKAQNSHVQPSFPPLLLQVVSVEYEHLLPGAATKCVSIRQLPTICTRPWRRLVRVV